MNAEPLSLRDVIAQAQAEAERLAGEPGYQARLAAERERDERALHEFKTRLWRDRVSSCAPLRVTRHIWDGMQQTAAVQAIDNWLAGGCKTDIVLRGGVGSGKSTSVAHGVKQLSEPDVMMHEGRPQEKGRKPGCCWLRPDALVSAIMHAYDDKAPKLAPYVVIDDLGRETRPEFVEAFCDLLDRDGHTLLITTNLKRDEMRKRYDLRVLDRLNERAIAFDIPGESMRKGKGDFR